MRYFILNNELFSFRQFALPFPVGDGARELLVGSGRRQAAASCNLLVGDEISKAAASTNRRSLVPGRRLQISI